MTIWEYLVEKSSVCLEEEALEEYLNSKGSLGWELVLTCAGNSEFVFKRKKGESI